MIKKGQSNLNFGVYPLEGLIHATVFDFFKDLAQKSISLLDL
jgi:hypothetical protein